MAHDFVFTASDDLVDRKEHAHVCHGTNHGHKIRREFAKSILFEQSGLESEFWTIAIPHEIIRK
jgi:hypothetical protein